jgi:hypothetical protein
VTEMGRHTTRGTRNLSRRTRQRPPRHNARHASTIGTIERGTDGTSQLRKEGAIWFAMLLSDDGGRLVSGAPPIGARTCIAVQCTSPWQVCDRSASGLCRSKRGRSAGRLQFLI